MESIRKNLFYQIAYQLLLILVPLVTTPYISRVLGPELIGEHAFVFSVVSYFVIFAMLGINSYGPEIVSKNRDNRSALSQIFSNLFFSHFIFSLLSIIAFSLFVLISSPGNYLIYLIQSLYLFSSLIEINWFFVGIEKIKFTALKSSLIKILTTVIIFIFVKNEDSLWIYALILSGSVFLNQIAFWPNLKKYVDFVRPDLKASLKLCLPLFKLFIPVIAVSLYKTMDKLMIGWFCSNNGMEELGFYDNAEKILNIPLGIITGLGVVMLPRMSYFVEKKSEEQIRQYVGSSLTLIFVFLIPCSFGLICISDLFVRLYFGEEFVGAIPVLQILSTTLVFMGCSNVLRTQILIPYDYQKQYTIAVVAGAFVNVASNLLLIQKFGAAGAAVGTLIAEVVVFGIQSFMVRKKVNVFKFYVKKIPFFCFAILMLKVLTSIDLIFENKIYSLIAYVLIGSLVYVLCSIVYILLLSLLKEKSFKRTLMEEI